MLLYFLYFSRKCCNNLKHLPYLTEWNWAFLHAQGFQKWFVHETIAFARYLFSWGIFAFVFAANEILTFHLKVPLCHYIMTPKCIKNGFQTWSYATFYEICSNLSNEPLNFKFVKSWKSGLIKFEILENFAPILFLEKPHVIHFSPFFTILIALVSLRLTAFSYNLIIIWFTVLMHFKNIYIGLGILVIACDCDETAVLQSDMFNLNFDFNIRFYFDYSRPIQPF